MKAEPRKANKKRVTIDKELKVNGEERNYFSNNNKIRSE
jgi:hypothetical protein